MIVVAYAVWEAQRWDAHTRTFPTIVGSALLVLLAGHLIVSLRADRAHARRASTFEGGAVEVDETGRRRQRAFMAWLLVFGAAIWVLSFPIGGPLATFAYLRAARERWPITIAITAATAAFFWLLTNVLNISFPQALLVQMVPR